MGQVGLDFGLIHPRKKVTMKEKTTTTKLFIAAITSCTQERKEGNEIVGGKHQETNTNHNQDLNHNNVWERWKRFVHLKKNTMMKKNVMTTIVAPTSYTQERKEGS